MHDAAGTGKQIESDLKWQARFFTIWGGQTLSLVGSALVRFALIWWLTEQTGSAAVLATANLVTVLPITLLGPVVGALVDRWRRRWIMVIADGAIALLTAGLALLYWLDWVAIWHVYAVLALRALGTAFHDPAMNASTSLMVPQEQLTRVAGMNQTRQSITQLAGPALGALLVVALPIQGVLAIDILTALLAVVPLLFLDVPQPATAKVQTVDQAQKQTLFGEIAAGVRYLWTWRGMCVVIGGVSLIFFFHRPSTSLVPLLVQEHFGGGPVEWAGMTIAFNAGSILGGIAMSTWGWFKPRVVNLLIGPFLLSLVNLARGLAPGDGYWIFLLATFVLGPTGALFFGSLRAILQSTVPPEMQGRVFSLQTSLQMAMAPLGLAILGPLGDVWGVQTLFVLAGTVSFLIAVTWALWPGVRRLDAGPESRIVVSTQDTV